MRQNVLQGLDSKPILISRQRHLRRGDFGAPKVGLLSGRFSLGPPFAKFQKKADLGVLAHRFGCLPICYIAAPRALLEPPFAPKCSPRIGL